MPRAIDRLRYIDVGRRRINHLEFSFFDQFRGYVR
jgi:hypothetical protein